ncbi:DNA gyrase inhibitor YacG [Comamonas jiangduensis]|uniref:DNA gyrase inhibitor YacG n=1 Tax=Comamonas jiangduensis TaxID=1194168 RepID=UPI001584440D|nr:DNA gyrase inhibitor YacG [Comamonas jiangduensis]QXW18845.1 DNA gyrase inhibitor YacG [Comamonas aquatica]
MSENTAPNTPPTVSCPTCGGPSLFAPSNPSRPFCSVRCKDIDLGAWAAEAFRVPAPPPQDNPFGDPRTESD